MVARFIHLPAVCVALLFGSAARADDLTVYAAASLRGAMDDVAAQWQAETSSDVTLVYAGSSALARQIEAGAPADLFFSANAAWMDMLEEGGHIDPGSRIDLLGNMLVVIGGRTDTAPLDLSDPSALSARLGTGRMALALTEAVPAGIYARQALTFLGLWDSVEDRVVESDNARTTLALVAMGAARLGVVYDTDARADPRVTVLAVLPPDSHDPIVYPLAATTGGDHAAATRFIAFLQSATQRDAFSRHGFTLVQGD
ncbi:MAG: molybdate ABC transporter substrate-binding protein [Roseicyclus sp.]